MEEQIKKYIKDNLRIDVGFEDADHPTGLLSVSLWLGRDKIDEKKVWINN